MWRTWPMLSAKMVAQKPGDSVSPPLSPLQPGLLCASADDQVTTTTAKADADASNAAVARALPRPRCSGVGMRVDPVLAMAMLHMSDGFGLTRSRVSRADIAT